MQSAQLQDQQCDGNMIIRARRVTNGGRKSSFCRSISIELPLSTESPRAPGLQMRMKTPSYWRGGRAWGMGHGA